MLPGVTVEAKSAAGTLDGRNRRQRHVPIPVAERPAAYEVTATLQGFKPAKSDVRGADPRRRFSR